MDKKMDNVSLVLCYLGLFKIVQSKLVFEVLNLLSSKLNEKSVELILLVLQTNKNLCSLDFGTLNGLEIFLAIGSFLRKESPLELKHFIEEVNTKSTSIKDENLINRSRLQFMLDTLQLIKNNNFLKVANCDIELNERFVKLLRSFFPGKQLESPLPMTLRDLWSAKVKGRWWIVGAAVTITRPEVEEKPGRSESSALKTTNFSEKLLKLAKKHHMNTDLRRNIFCIVVSSEDYLDAFEKLCRLSLKGQQEREIIHIILTCCLIEKSYNPFYAYLLQRFCHDQPRFLLTAQFAFWDKIKLISSSTKAAIENLARCLAHLLANKTVPLAILKVIDFGSLEKSLKKFCTILFDDFLTNVSDDNLKQIFANCLSSKQHEGKYEHLVDEIRTFFSHFFVKSLEKRQAKNLSIVKKKIEVLDHYLYYQLGSSLL
uniref:MI domain-containing protein n=1 Tax=Romanomermis culicivorax TaxID=13658 RepID=A0A915JHM9_ROMCU